MIEELQKLYDAEINFSITTFWDAGFTVKIGDEINGFVAQANFDTAKEAIAWVIEKAKELYPEIEKQ